MGTLALISLGSNLGDRKATLDDAIARLAEAPGVEVRAVSTYHETAPVGGPTGQGAFLNAAASLETSLDPNALLSQLRELEHRAGRVRNVRWGERTLDLDLLLHGATILDTPTLHVPHPRLGVRRFVLAPLAEIAPEVIDPVTGWTITELLANLDRRPSLVALAGFSHPRKHMIFEHLVGALGAVGVSLELTPGRTPSLDDLSNQDPFDLLDRQRAALRADRWSDLGDRWIVADFAETDLIYSLLKWPWDEFEDLRLLHLERGREVRREIVAPTFVVVPGLTHPVLRRTRQATRESFIAEFPSDPEPELGRLPELVLWIDSDDPRTILEETLAACAASRA